MAMRHRIGMVVLVGVCMGVGGAGHGPTLAAGRHSVGAGELL